MSDTVEIVQLSDTERARIVPDTDSESPREWTNVGVMAAHGHQRYRLGDQTPFTKEVHEAIVRIGPMLTARWLRIFHGATCVLPLGLIDHSGISMYVGGAHPMDPQGWDSGLVGLIFDTPDSRKVTGLEDAPENVEKALRGEVEVYDQFLTGQVYGVVWEKKGTPCSACGHDPGWEETDSVYGLFGIDVARETAREGS